MTGIEGEDRLGIRLGELLEGVTDKVQLEVIAGAFSIASDAVESIQRGPKTGRVYRRGKGIVHQASKEGEAPASDTGNLARRIDVQLSGDKLSASIGVHNLLFTPYARRLELEMGRAYMGPAYDKNIKKIRERLRKAVSAGLK